MKESGKAGKLRVAVLFGGRSGEHEISLRSAASVIRNLDRNEFEIVPVGIDKQGRWHLNDLSLLEAKGGPALELQDDAPPIVLPPYASGRETQLATSNGLASRGVDVVFPIMHGPLCEDGTIQGLFELADVAYVGSGVLGSAVGMDKDVAKRLARDAGIPVVPWVCIRRGEWLRKRSDFTRKIAEELGFPAFVKPANMGSSVGVHKVKSAADLEAAIDDAFRYDLKVLVEKGIAAREIEYAVLDTQEENEPPAVSIPGEIVPTHEFYSYDAKYIDDDGAKLLIPANVTEEQARRGAEIARKTFTVLDLEGLARVDLFLDKSSGEFYLNEVNTMPGFTTISMYPKLWEASGVSYQDLLTRLVRLAVARHERHRQLRREK